MGEQIEGAPLKILRVIARLNVGGPARHVMLLDRGLRSRGYSTLLVHGAVAPGEASMEHLVASHHLPAIKVPQLGRRISVWSDLQALAALLRITFHEAPDIIHTHTAKAGTLGRFAAALYNATRPRARRALIVHTFHGHVLSGYFGPIRTALVRLAERVLARLTDCIVTISPSQRNDIVKKFRVAVETRVVTIPLGLDLHRLLTMNGGVPGLRARLSIDQGDVVFGYIGRFAPIKDLPTLLAAFRLVVAQVPSAWLVLAGDGPSRATIAARAAQEGIAARVCCVGWTEDLPAFYGAIDVCVLSSLNEGTPVALIEAMAAGKPVVATSVGGIVDIVASGRTGILVPPGRAEALAGAMIELAYDSRKRAAMGQAARTEVEPRFSHDRLVSDIDRLYVARLAQKRGTIRPVP